MTGSPARSASAAATTANYAYSPYGDTVKSGTDATPVEYTGRENDGATGLYYYRARYYSPQLGRFISEDPLGFAGGLNAYRYAGGSPLNFADPTGLYCLDVNQARALIGKAITYSNYALDAAKSIGAKVSPKITTPLAIISMPFDGYDVYDPEKPTDRINGIAGLAGTSISLLAEAAAVPADIAVLEVNTATLYYNQVIDWAFEFDVKWRQAEINEAFARDPSAF